MIQKLETIAELVNRGRVRLGMTRSELHQLLGRPDQEGGTSRKYPVPCIYKYGDVEFVFPVAKSAKQTESRGLLYVYVDDGIDDLQEPLFLLGGEKRGPGDLASPREASRREVPMIGGIDVRIPSIADDLSLEVAVRAIRQVWPGAVFENGFTGERYDSFGEIPFGEVEEIFVYRGRAAAEIWDAEGAIPAAPDTMIHLIADPGWVTAVVDQRTDTTNEIIDAIESALADRPLIKPERLDAA